MQNSWDTLETKIDQLVWNQEIYGSKAVLISEHYIGDSSDESYAFPGYQTS